MYPLHEVEPAISVSPEAAVGVVLNPRKIEPRFGRPKSLHGHHVIAVFSHDHECRIADIRKRWRQSFPPVEAPASGASLTVGPNKSRASRFCLHRQSPTIDVQIEIRALYASFQSRSVMKVTTVAHVAFCSIDPAEPAGPLFHCSFSAGGRRQQLFCSTDRVEGVALRGSALQRSRTS